MTVWPDVKKFVPNEPGITKQSAAWLIDNGAVLLGADNMGVEKFPMAKESVHTYVFAEALEQYWQGYGFLKQVSGGDDLWADFYNSAGKCFNDTYQFAKEMSAGLTCCTEKPKCITGSSYTKVRTES